MRRKIAVAQAEDVEHAASLAGSHPDLGGRDLLHAEVMRRLGVQRIVSANAGFDQLPGVERLDSARITDWQGLAISYFSGPTALFPHACLA